MDRQLDRTTDRWMELITIYPAFDFELQRNSLKILIKIMKSVKSKQRRVKHHKLNSKAIYLKVCKKLNVSKTM